MELKTFTLSIATRLKKILESLPTFYVPQDAAHYKRNIRAIFNLETAVHEVLGHSTTRLLTEIRPGVFNFDRENLPINPFTGKAIETWYKSGQRVPGFEKLETTVEELRASLVSFYLVDNRDILSTFGFDETSTVSADDS